MDVEDGATAPVANNPHKGRNRDFFEAAGLLALWSLLVINEGLARFLETNPSVDLTDSLGLKPARMVRFLAALGEVIFGMIGAFVGFSAFLYKWYSTSATKIAMGIQAALGWFVFIVFVFLIPAFRAADLGAPLFEGLTLSTSKFVIVLGLLTSAHFCLALQGGQFIMFARLICAATGDDFLMQKSGLRMRSVFWHANLALAGVWTFITGVIINVEVGGGKLDMPFMSPPNVGRLPGFTIFTGLVMFTWSAFGIFMALRSAYMPAKSYFPIAGLVYIIMFLNYSMLQFALFDDTAETTRGSALMHHGLVFMVVFLGPYFTLLSMRESKAKMDY